LPVLFCSTRVNVDVELADDNDNTPVFVNTPYITTVDEVRQ